MGEISQILYLMQLPSSEKKTRKPTVHQQQLTESRYVISLHLDLYCISSEGLGVQYKSSSILYLC